MTFLEAILLGILQGLTEFLPVSSSGHLVLAQQFLGLKEPLVFFDVMLHVGTLAAVLVAYREAIGKLVIGGFSALGNSQLWRHPSTTINTTPELKFIWLILLGSIPTGIIAVVFKTQLESFFEEVRLVSVMLILTGAILQLPRLRREKVDTPEDATGSLKAWHAPLIGIAQGCAITPGISRSGTTISLALFLGIPAKNGGGILFPTLNSRHTRCGCAESPRPRRYDYTAPHRGWRNARFVYCRLCCAAIPTGRAKPRQILSLFVLLYRLRARFPLNRPNPVGSNTSQNSLIIVPKLWYHTDTA